MGAVCTALEQTGLGTGIKYTGIQALNLYWNRVRLLYSCFGAPVRASDSSVFDHEMMCIFGITVKWVHFYRPCGALIVVLFRR